MILPRETWSYPGWTIGREVRLYDELPSTNDTAAALAQDPTQHGVVIVAEHQTAGRGQHGRVWQASADSSLLMSIILPPLKELLRPVVLTAWAAVNVAAAIRKFTGSEAVLKWPNDLLIDVRKVCGILIEQGRGTVVGIGLNLNQTEAEFADRGLNEATSLSLLTGRVHDPRSVLEAVLDRLNESYVRIAQGSLHQLEQSWKDRIGLSERTVVLERSDGTQLQGRLVEISFDGLALDQGTDEIAMIVPETIRHVTAVGIA